MGIAFTAAAEKSSELRIFLIFNLSFPGVHCVHGCGRKIT